MKLVLQANLPLDKLQEYAVNIFGKIPDRGETKPDYHPQKHSSFANQDMAKVLRVVPPSPGNVFCMTFSFPAQKKNYSCCPIQFLKYILTFEGKGSLYCYLQKKNIAAHVYCFDYHGHTRFSSDLQILVDGFDMNEWHIVYTAIWQYLEFIKNTGEDERRSVFDEMASM